MCREHPITGGMRDCYYEVGKRKEGELKSNYYFAGVVVFANDICPLISPLGFASVWTLT